MRTTNKTLRLAFLAVAAAGLVCASGCEKKDGKDKDETKKGAKAEAAGPEDEKGQQFTAEEGVDVEDKTIHIGALNDESGPAATIGKPFAVGKRMAANRINEGDGELLPEGWSVELHEEDHQYNPSKSVQAYKKIKEDVLFIATSFGTPNTLPLRKFLERDKLVAFPASLSSKMAAHEMTPPLAPSYKMEAMRAMDWAVENAGGADEVSAGLIYQKDDYGKDGQEGWLKAAEAHGVEIVAEESISPGQKDVTAVVKSLQDAGANYVLLTVLPSTSGPILGTAAQMKYMPTWLGNTPAWIDGFFGIGKEEPPLDAKVFQNFYWVTGLPYWGEDVPGMDEFMKSYEKFGKEQYQRDFYILTSYIQGLVQSEILTRAIEDGDLSRENFIEQMHTIDGWDAGGMIQPIDLSEAPYMVGTETRVLKPMMEEKTWDVAGAYKTPEAVGNGKEGGEQ